jgi:hypothetical protein
MALRKRRKKLVCDYADHKTWYGKTWHFLWHKDTVLSFLTDAVIIILIGKFILFPLAGVALHTDLPAVAVISDSMDHRGQTFDTWWANHGGQYARHNITASDFSEYDFENGFHKGDILIVKGQASYSAGDVIVYDVSARPVPIIHRTVYANETYQTKGDANSGQIGFETSIGTEQIRGKAVFRIPYFGWPKVWLVEIFS